MIVLTTVLVNNVVLSQFLGLCPFLGASRRLDAAIGLGSATALVLVIACTAAYALETWVLRPLEAPALRTISFIFAIAVAVQIVELTTRALSPLLHRVLGIYLPLITTNCAVLGIALQSVRSADGFVEVVVTALGSAVGFFVVMVLFASLRERVSEPHVPGALRGAPVALIGASLLSLAFMGFVGLDR
ncbi:MAG: electron transport complex subunit RsxA [Chromatiales bacterium]|nr:electron transport complex subunit RsxA [Chromatiales bacterium]